VKSRRGLACGRCIDCGVDLPRRTSGRGSHPLRCDACRTERVNIRKQAWASRQKGYHVCACGKPRAVNAAQCWACYAETRCQPVHVCEYCKQSFQPKRSVNPARFQFNKYCSRACYFAVKKATACERLVAHELARTIAHEQRRQKREQQEHLCACGATINVKNKRCRRCFLKQAGSVIRETRELARVTGVDHLCPNCGQWFKGYESSTFCSERCCLRLRRDRYASIRHLPLEERNNLAELIALTREANRRIQNSVDVGYRYKRYRNTEYRFKL